VKASLLIVAALLATVAGLSTAAAATHVGVTVTSGSSKLGRVLVDARGRGTAQVAYAGHPLYRFVQDTRRGQTAGEDLHDFDAGWYVVSRSGKKVEQDGS